MTVKLFDTAEIQAVADAIRAKDGDAALMTVGEMPARIGALLPKEYREVWLFANQQQKTPDMIIDTGVAADGDHIIEVICYANIYSSTTPFGSVTANNCRQVINLLSTNNKIRFAWGNSGLQTFEYATTELSFWRPMTVRLSKTGWQVNGYAQNYGAVTKSGTWPSTPGAPSTANYKIYGPVAATSTDAEPGFFRRARIYDASETLLHEFVPVLYSDFSLALLDKVTGAEIALPTGAAGYSGVWSPHTDARVGLAA